VGASELAAFYSPTAVVGSALSGPAGADGAKTQDFDRNWRWSGLGRASLTAEGARGAAEDCGGTGLGEALSAARGSDTNPC
jgi:hypothetical protein